MNSISGLWLAPRLVEARQSWSALVQLQQYGQEMQ